MKVIFVSAYLEIECQLIAKIMNYSLNLDFLFLFSEYFIKSHIFLILILYSTGVIDFILTKPIGIIKMRFSSLLLWGGCRLDRAEFSINQYV